MASYFLFSLSTGVAVICNSSIFWIHSCFLGVHISLSSASSVNSLFPTLTKINLGSFHSMCCSRINVKENKHKPRELSLFCSESSSWRICYLLAWLEKAFWEPCLSLFHHTQSCLHWLLEWELQTLSLKGVYVGSCSRPDRIFCPF
jgi:hypothetical protein